MADKKSLFDKYKIIGENGEEMSAEDYTPAVPGGEIIEIPEEEDLPVVEALTGFPDAVRETLENLPATDEVPHPIEENEEFSIDEIVESVRKEQTEMVEEPFEEEISFEQEASDVPEEKTETAAEEVILFSDKEESVNVEAALPDFDVATKKEKVKKQKKSKPIKEKKIKEPKPKKVRQKKEKKTSDDTVQFEPLTKKDHITFGLAIFALVLAIAFLCIKYFPTTNSETPDTSDEIKITQTAIKTIQLDNGKIEGELLKTDFDNIFCVVTSGNEVLYYQCENGKLNPIQPEKKISVSVKETGSEITAEISYISRDGKVSGYGLYTGEQTANKMLLKLTDLPRGYEADGKALLLASENNGNFWSDSFIAELENGKTERFLEKKANKSDYCVLTDEGLDTSNGKIPFFSGRNYENGNKKDLFVKEGTRETLLATDIYGDLVIVDGDAFIYLVKDEKGEVKVVRNENGEETETLSLQGDAEVRYSFENGFIIDKAEGVLYSVSSGEKISLDGYTVTEAEEMAVSDDGKYLVVLGYVENITDYQVQIFDLTTGKCSKYSDEIFLQHTSLHFVDNGTIVYTTGNAYQGCQYTTADISKAK